MRPLENRARARIANGPPPSPAIRSQPRRPRRQPGTNSPVLSRPRVSCTGSGRNENRLVAPCRPPATCCQHAGANRHQPAMLPAGATPLHPRPRFSKTPATCGRALLPAACCSLPGLPAARQAYARHLPDTQASTLRQKLPALPAALRKAREAAPRKPSPNANRERPAALSVTRDRPVLQFESRLRGPRSPDRENATLARLPLLEARLPPAARSCYLLPTARGPRGRGSNRTLRGRPENTSRPKQSEALRNLRHCVYRIHFGSRYKLGCCDFAGLSFF